MENNNAECPENGLRWNNIRKNLRFTKIYKFISNSAIFGLVLTLAIFVYEQYKSSMQTKEIVDNLMYVQKSLSTKYLGIFPDYLDRINEILENAQAKDTVVIFEDVLYYGSVSKPEEFKKMHKKLISLAYSGSQVTIVFYHPKGRNFRRMIIDLYVSTKYLAQMDMERRALLQHEEKGKRINFKEFRSKDSLVCEQYYDKTRVDSPDGFRENVDKYRKPLANITGAETGLTRELENLYDRMDSVKSAWLAADYDKICLRDFENMFREITDMMSEEYQKHGVELLPIDENLPISCWLVSDKAILAFPSKYASDEIGFFSQDPAFSKYIKIMLNGVRGNYAKIKR